MAWMPPSGGIAMGLLIKSKRMDSHYDAMRLDSANVGRC